MYNSICSSLPAYTVSLEALVKAHVLQAVMPTSFLPPSRLQRGACNPSSTIVLSGRYFPRCC